MHAGDGEADATRFAIDNGDCSSDGARDISDATCLLTCLFNDCTQPVASAKTSGGKLSTRTLSLRLLSAVDAANHRPAEPAVFRFTRL